MFPYFQKWKILFSIWYNCIYFVPWLNILLLKKLLPCELCRTTSYPEPSYIRGWCIPCRALKSVPKIWLDWLHYYVIYNSLRQRCIIPRPIDKCGKNYLASLFQYVHFEVNGLWIIVIDGSVASGKKVPLFTQLYLPMTTSQANMPKEIADYLNKMGARIPNIKPGKATIEYLTQIQASTRFWGTIISIVSIIFLSCNAIYLHQICSLSPSLCAVVIILQVACC